MTAGGRLSFRSMDDTTDSTIGMNSENGSAVEDEPVDNNSTSILPVPSFRKGQTAPATTTTTTATTTKQRSSGSKKPRGSFFAIFQKKPPSEKAAKSKRRDSKKKTSGGANQKNGTAAENSSNSNLPKHPDDSDGAGDSDHDDDDDDPVMDIFEARSTQRVRFTVGSTVQPSRVGRPRRDKSPPPSNAQGPLSPSASIKRFMKGALFGSGSGGKQQSQQSNSNNNNNSSIHSKATDDFDLTLKKEIDLARKDSTMVWEDDDASKASDWVRSRSKKHSGKFVEDKLVRANVSKLRNKARRAQTVHYRYEYAVNCYIKALTQLTDAHYPDEHELVQKTVQALNQAHHALNSYKNSANIVKMGIRYEDSGELVRALKMYTIAYRIRRDNLSRSHPSLVVLLNMLGSIQIKRGELEEAMQIYELALKPAETSSSGAPAPRIRPHNLLARGVTYREMGTIHERWGETDQALAMYHSSLDCVLQYKARTGTPTTATTPKPLLPPPAAAAAHTDSLSPDGMEMTIEGNVAGMEDKKGRKKKSTKSSTGNGSSSNNTTSTTSSAYDQYFPKDQQKLKQQQQQQSSSSKKDKKKDKKKSKSKTDYADVDVAVTLHQIGQLHRAKGEFDDALSAYHVALRGMRQTLGKNHPNTAAILGNIGNLQKEMGDMDAAFDTYQQVLSIESYRLGLSHPDVAVTLHNIATIDAARGNNEHALVLYKQVMNLQRKLFGENNPSVAVTAACMGDVYERLGNIQQATECFEEAVRIKTAALGRHSLEVARLLHKLGKLAALNGDFHLADSYTSRCVLVYRLNKLSEEDEWVVDAYRDAADIDAAIAMGRGNTFEC